MVRGLDVLGPAPRLGQVVRRRRERERRAEEDGLVLDVDEHGHGAVLLAAVDRCALAAVDQVRRVADLRETSVKRVDPLDQGRAAADAGAVVISPRVAVDDVAAARGKVGDLEDGADSRFVKPRDEAEAAAVRIGHPVPLDAARRSAGRRGRRRAELRQICRGRGRRVARHARDPQPHVLSRCDIQQVFGADGVVELAVHQDKG
mmetsp:Transcript_6879/g.24651  ORF Transcript_6879/g.24651 Transcript_6879/m.24651 type:complete len:204 (+) Transcript_6879:1585-2196(+)